MTTAALSDAVNLAWSDLRSGLATGAKSVLSFPEDTFWRQSGFTDKEIGFAGERLGWKLSCLYAAGPRYAGVKIIGANAFNRMRGLSRSTSTFILMEKFSMLPLAILDATQISARRTGIYASTVFDLISFGCEPVEVFLFGAGPIAAAILDALAFGAGQRIARVFIKARHLESAQVLVDGMARSLPFALQAVEDNRLLKQAGFVITATNAREPVFADDELLQHASLLHLGGDEVPAQTLRRILKSGVVGCDDLARWRRLNRVWDAVVSST